MKAGGAERRLRQISSWGWVSVSALALTHLSWGQMLRFVTVREDLSGSPSAKAASIMDDRLMLSLPLMVSHPICLETRCGAPEEAARREQASVGSQGRRSPGP